MLGNGWGRLSVSVSVLLSEITVPWARLSGFETPLAREANSIVISKKSAAIGGKESEHVPAKVKDHRFSRVARSMSRKSHWPCRVR